MWILRFLSGPMAGKIIPLTKHSTLLGRAPNCDIKIPSSSISKEHLRIEVFDDKLILTDTGSRNGTFMNGVQIRSTKAKSGDKIALHDIFFEIQKVPESWGARFQQQQAFAPLPGAIPGTMPGAGHAGGGGMPGPYYDHNLAYQMQPPPTEGAAPQMHAQAHGSAVSELLQGKFPRWALLIQEYLDRVVLPGVYKLPELFEFKWVLLGFMAAFIILVTTLSTIPLIHILKSSIEQESQQHALTIATVLARVNRPALAQGMDTALSVDVATSRPGVKKAYIISNVDGNVLAPASAAGTFPDEPYINAGRQLDHQSVKQVDDSTVVALVPIEFFNSETGAHAITAWAVVHYDMGSLAIDNGQILSLFITTLFIALILGLFLFYFLYKIVEHPIHSLNVQLDSALKDGHETVQVNYQFPALQKLISNISSALTRLTSGNEGAANANRGLEHDRKREVSNLVELIGFAAMGIHAHDLSIAAVNQAFESRIGTAASQLTTMTLNELNDQALKLSVKDLIERLDQNPDEIASNDLEFSGLNFQVVAQAVFGTNAIAYYVIVLLPKSEGEG